MRYRVYDTRVIGMGRGGAIRTLLLLGIADITMKI